MFGDFAEVRGVGCSVNRETSIYLDLVRFTAAITVLLSHLGASRFTGGFLWQIGPYGDEAVDVFFVLSGFVIAYVAGRSETNISSYTVARLARIYSVALPALVATFALDALGRLIRPDLYSASWGYVAEDQIQQFLAGLFFVNRIWGHWIKQGSDVSYWSLGYEVWYYIFFAAAVFGRGRWKVVCAIAAVCIAGPDILSLFPLWLLGVGCYHLCKRNALSAKAGALLWLSPLVVWIGYEIWAWHHLMRGDGPAPEALFHRPQILQDYLIATLFALHLVGFRAFSAKLSAILNRAEPAIRWAAGATFTIYLFHFPVAQFLRTLIPWPPSNWATRAVILGVTLATMFLIAEITERQKEPWRKIFEAIIARRQRAVSSVP